jgi:hypothetical protein
LVVTDDEALEVVLDAVRGISASADGDIRWLERMLVLTRGHYAADHVDFVDATEIAEVEAAWAAIGERLPERELLYIFGMGGHPGGSWADIVRAHDLPQGTCLYTWETDIADVGQQGTFLIAGTENATEQVDARVVETVLSTSELRGLELARSAMSGTLDEMRTVLPRHRLVALLVEVLGEGGDLFSGPNEIFEELARGARAP